MVTFRRSGAPPGKSPRPFLGKAARNVMDTRSYGKNDDPEPFAARGPGTTGGDPLKLRGRRHPGEFKALVRSLGTAPPDPCLGPRRCSGVDLGLQNLSGLCGN